MPDLKFDTLVIGAGPAGSSAAYQLAALGLSVCMVDRSGFPRDKLCGGLVTQRCKKNLERVFERPLDTNQYTTASDIEFHMAGRYLQEQNGYSDMHLVMRRSFDHHLLDLAQARGAVVFTHTVVTDIDLDHQLVKTQDGKTIHFKFLVGADGVNSQVAKKILGASINLDTIGFALEIEVPRMDLPAQKDKVEIDFGAAVWGYGWCFPKRETFTIGVCGLLRKNPELKQRMHEYLAHKGLAGSNYKIKGHHIPFGDYKKQPGRKNVLLVGDAAGAVDSISGEGIAYAIETGEYAAKAIALALENKTQDAMQYYQTAFTRIVSDIKAANFWRWFIYPSFIFKYFSGAFAQAGTLQRGYLDIVAGKHGYSKLPYLFTIQVLRGIKKAAIKLVPFSRA